MLISFEHIINTYGKPRGIIHIGAHYMQEREDYNKFFLTDTIWIEANTEIVNNLKNTVVLNPGEKIYNYAIIDSSENEIDLHIMSFDQSSSIFSLGEHKKYYPQIKETRLMKVPAKRMDVLIDEFDIDTQHYDFLNLDVQGAELLVLKSFGKYLNDLKFIYTEINIESLYQGCCLLPELNSFLEERGFKEAETRTTNEMWGDSLYIKQ